MNTIRTSFIRFDMINYDEIITNPNPNQGITSVKTVVTSDEMFYITKNQINVPLNNILKGLR